MTKNWCLELKFGYSTQVKYVGVIFDSKLAWNYYIEKVICKATLSLFICKKMINSKWGLRPKYVLWIYTAIVRPIVTFASIVWWEKTTRKNIQRKLNKLQRLVCLMTLGCSNLTTMALMEVILDIPPLHLSFKYESTNMNLKFKHSEFREIRNLTETDLTRIEDENQTLQITFTDYCLKRYEFRLSFRVFWGRNIR